MYSTVNCIKIYRTVYFQFEGDSLASSSRKKTYSTEVSCTVHVPVLKCSGTGLINTVQTTTEISGKT